MDVLQKVGALAVLASLHDVVLLERREDHVLPQVAILEDIGIDGRVAHLQVDESVVKEDVPHDQEEFVDPFVFLKVLQAAGDLMPFAHRLPHLSVHALDQIVNTSLLCRFSLQNSGLQLVESLLQVFVGEPKDVPKGLGGVGFTFLLR